MLFSQVFICSVITFTLTAAQTKEDEGRPYEFGFTIDGEQHRHEKKDENGIIQGEFGFITADGIYHVTVYATDENGDFKILSMRNVRISAPLDGSPGPGPVSSQPVGPNAKVQPNLLQAEPKPLPPIQSAPPSLVPSTTPVVFTTRPTIKPGCAGCGVVNKTATLAPLPFQVAQQNAALNKQSNVGPSSQFSQNENNQYQNNPYAPNSTVGPNYSDGQNNFNQNSASVGSSYPGGPNSFNQNSATGSNYPGGQNNFNQNSPSVGTNYPGGQNQYPEGQNQFNSPGNYPGGQNQYNQGGQNAPVNPNYPQTQSQFNSPGNSNYPGEPAKPGNENNVNYNGVSNDLGNKPNAVPPGFNQPPNPKPNPLQIPKLPPVSVDDNVIHVQGERPQNIPIRDKYPGMVDGLPEGIDEGDIKDLLYKFHYTVGFHGHYEKGLKNGAKVGGYFVNGRDGVSRVVTYVADENGYRPKFKFIRLGLDSDETPKEGSEKTFGLKSFEFVWYPVN